MGEVCTVNIAALDERLRELNPDEHRIACRWIATWQRARYLAWRAGRVLTLVPSGEDQRVLSVDAEISTLPDMVDQRLVVRSLTMLQRRRGAEERASQAAKRERRWIPGKGYERDE